MYENITFDVILERMLATIPEDVDKREGSIVYNALAPAAVELQNMYIQLDTILNQTFADTATREFLILRAKERGLSPTPATNAVLQGEFNMDVAIDSRFSLGDTTLNYTAISKISDGVFQMQCETPGTVGNSEFGTLIPIDYISGLTSASLTSLLIPAEDEEDTEHFRQRYYDSFDTQAFGGNIADYKEKVNAISGVGGVKVTPIWNGGGTVKLTIISSDFTVPTQTLIDTVQTDIDPTQNQGKGVGLAPIGHVVTVVGVTNLTVNIATTITYEDGWSWADIETYAQQAVDGYFKELAQSWEDSEGLIVRISQIETRFLEIEGVLDISGTTLNGGTTNLTLTYDQIPLRGTLNG
jgi:uncharacterized phage protein gp47/JayE